MRHLVRLLGQRLVVIVARGVGIERQVELVLPAEFEARARQGVVAQLRGRVALGEVGGVCRDLVGDHAFLHVVAVGQTEMLFWRHVAEHGGTEPADHGSADRRGYVVVARRDVGRQWPKRIELRLPAFFKLLLNVYLYLVHRHVAGTFDHHLTALVPRDLGELPQRLQLGELSAAVSVGDRTGTQAVAERERHVILAHNVADLVETLVEEGLLVPRQTPLGHDRAAARNDAGDAVGGEVDVPEPHARMDGEIVDALLALLDQRVLVALPIELDGISAHLLQRLVDRHGPDRHRRVADDPLARVVDVTPRGEVHHGVGAPADRPYHLFDFFLDRGRDGAVADVGVDFG